MAREIGKTGLAAFRGRIQEDFLTDLRWPDAYKLYNEMRMNSPIIGALLMGIELSVRACAFEWTSEDETDPRVQILNDAEDGMSHNMLDHITEVLTMLPFGWSLFEIVYQPNGSRIGWRKFAIRGQDTLYQWLFDEAGGLAGMKQRLGWGEQFEIPIEKAILYRTKSEKGNPEGRSILRTAYLPYYFAKNHMEIEAIGFERGMNGIPVMQMPYGATTGSTSGTDQYKSEEIVRNIRIDEQMGIVLPPPVGEGDHHKFVLSLLSTGSNTAFETDAVIKRYESRMLMSTLSQFMMLGMDKVGSLALSKDQTDFFLMAVNGFADIIAETLTKYAAPRLLAMNGITDFDGVKLEHSPAGDIDMTQVADFLQKVGTAITWTAADEAWLRQAVRLPERTEEEIEEAKERAKEEQAAIFEQQAAARPAFGGQQGDMGVELWPDSYAADNAPDDEERRKMERRLERRIKQYRGELNRRVMRGARRIGR